MLGEKEAFSEKIQIFSDLAHAGPKNAARELFRPNRSKIRADCAGLVRGERKPCR
jgi:hypothetical protein